LTNPEEKTSGNGYYSSNEKNQPILEPFYLDKSFTRNEDDYGTDVYILGFDMVNNWESSVISKVLESFMVAIIRNNLEVIVNKQSINYTTVGKVIDKGFYIRKKDSNLIHAQYELLTSKNIFAEEFEYEDYGKFELRIKAYSHQEASSAVNNCLMVRYPYMKIKTFDHLTHIPHSAICIIADNELNRTLRRIENPQHTDWEINRVKDSDQKKIISKILRDLKVFISEKIREYLLESDHKQSDIEGASEYLPDSDKGDYERDKQLTTHVSELKKNKTGLPIGQSPNEDSMGLEPEIGGNEEDEDGGHFENEGDRKRNGDKPIKRE
jgi:hypothetical protein